jgi:tetrapyrrole methylase family protein/MazG family protein
MKEFDNLVHILEILRAPGGCPWDAEQDHSSIAHCAIEEAYELLDAIEAGDPGHIREELGDILLQVVFHSLIARDAGEFTLKDVIDGLSLKLISRHAHVFGGPRAGSSSEVVERWQKIKEAELGGVVRSSILDGIPGGMSPLMAARKMQSAASRVGFDWKDPKDVIAKISEELSELAAALDRGGKDAVKEELGDLLFTVVNCARLCSVEPEAALAAANRKFRERFSLIEREAKKRGKGLIDMSLEEMDEIWESAKDSRTP